MSNDLLQVNCDICGEFTQEPYIECCECDINLCTGCFSTGREARSHKSNHSYAVRRNDFPLFENCNWSAKEECKLLSALSTYGYGNWEEIAKIVNSRSKLECQEHYKKYYIENVQYQELDILPETKQSMFPKPVIPYLFNTEPSRDPPRNKNTEHIAGYNAYRSEFEFSYDHNTESILNIEDHYLDDDGEDEPFMDALKVAIVNALNTRLKERHRWYSTIKRHGLILPHKLLSWSHRFDKTLPRQKLERILPFMQFMTGMQFDAFVESLSLEIELFQKIVRLSEYRRMGIKTLYGITLYKRQKVAHESILKLQKCAANEMSTDFSEEPSHRVPTFTKDGQVKKFQRTIKPLEIIDLPGFNLLNKVEKTLCSNLRLKPSHYLEIKELLISANNKLGSLRLLDARRIVKIDVNKTRKIYDLMAAEGFIQPS